MAEYQWAGWGILPLIQSKSEFDELLANNVWQHWSKNKTDSQIKDIRRFYTRSSAALLRPMTGGRYVIELVDTSIGQLALQTKNFAVALTQIQVLRIEGVTLFYFHISSEQTYDANTISEINRTAFAWQPKTHNHNLVCWNDVNQVSKPLCEHLSTLLGMQLNSESNYGEDAFGHELVSCSWIKSNGKNKQGALCVSKLSAGIDLSDPRYKLDDEALTQLQSQKFAYWDDWRCQLGLNKLVFVDETSGPSTLQFNLDEYGYYLDLFAAVISQRIMLNHFKDELVLGHVKKKALLFDKITSFRRTFSAGHVSTYPFADKLYQYLCERASLAKIEEKTFIELEHSHTLWKQKREESSSKVLFFVAVIAALLLPASSLATIFALTEKQMNFYFWCSSIGITIITMILIVAPLIYRKLRDGKELKHG